MLPGAGYGQPAMARNYILRPPRPNPHVLRDPNPCLPGLEGRRYVPGMLCQLTGKHEVYFLFEGSFHGPILMKCKNSWASHRGRWYKLQARGGVLLIET